MEVGSKVLYGELQIKFDFHYAQPTFSWVIALCPSHSFSGLSFAMLSQFWMKFGSKLLYEDLQFKFDFRHGRPTSLWVIVLCPSHLTHLIHSVHLILVAKRIFGGSAGTCIALGILLVCLLSLIYVCSIFLHFGNVNIFSPTPVKSEGTIGLHSCLSVRQSHSFSSLFFAMLSYIWMKVGCELLYKELQIRFDQLLCESLPFVRYTQFKACT